jgi:N-acetylmuramoyl-L-alanine amidase
MRRVLAVLVAAGLCVWLAGPALSARPFVPQAVDFVQAIAPDAGTAAPAGTAGGGGGGGGGGWRSAIIRAPERFDLVGLTWRRSARIDARIRVRDAARGTWSAWTAMSDDSSGDEGSEPVWAGGADAYELRLKSYPAGLRAHFVNSTGTATAGQRLLTALRRHAHDAYVALTGAPAQAQGQDGAPAIVARADWGASQCKPRADPTYGSVQTAFVHHTVNANDYGPQDSAAIVLAICRYHRDTNGWYDIGYNFLVDRFGTVFEGRAGGVDQAVIGAQAQGYNSVSTGVAEIGTFSAVAPSAAATQATEDLLAWKLSLTGVPALGHVTVRSGGGPDNRYATGTPVTFQRISGHRDADQTSCPGTALYRRLPAIRDRVAAIAAQLSPPAPVATVTLAAADRTLQYPQDAQLSGRVTDPGGAPLPATAVSIQIASRAGFATVAEVTTREDGTWSAQVPTQYKRTLRAVVRPASGGVAASPLLSVAVAPQISLRAPRHVVAGRAFAVSGSVHPQRTAATLEVARKGSDGAFHVLARLPVKVAGTTFRTTLRLRRAALHRLRVLTVNDARNAPGRSGDVLLRAVRAG